MSRRAGEGCSSAAALVPILTHRRTSIILSTRSSATVSADNRCLPWPALSLVGLLCASLVTSRFLTGGGKIARKQRPRDAASGAKSSEGFYFVNTSLNHKTLGCFAFDRALPLSLCSSRNRTKTGSSSDRAHLRPVILFQDNLALVNEKKEREKEREREREREKVLVFPRGLKITACQDGSR